MSLKSEDLIKINLNELKFKKLKQKTDVSNYLITNFENKKVTVILENIDIPFGVEIYEKKHILNIEINPKKSNQQYNYYAIISGFEQEISNLENFKYEKLLRDLEGKGYYPNIKKSKEGYIIRTHIFNTPEVFTMLSGKDKSVRNIKDNRILQDVKKVRANIELELGTLWINDNNYGFSWYVKQIEILHSL